MKNQNTMTRQQRRKSERTANNNVMTIEKAKQIIKNVPYDDSAIEQWLKDDRMISQWIQGAQSMNTTLANDKLRGISTEEVVEAYEAEYRRMADNQGVGFNAYLPMFFLAKEEIKNRFIANQFLKDMKVIKF